MKISIFVKTFITLLLSFVLLFIGSQYYLYQEFSTRYVEENISLVKQAIIDSASDLESNGSLEDSLLEETSSETQYIRLTNNVIVDTEGPTILEEDEIIFFVIDILDDNQLITEGDLSYTIKVEEDIHTISYLYKFDNNDYLLVLTKIQSLNNVGVVLEDITIAQGTILLVVIVLLSLIISTRFTSPIRKINNYAKAIARLDFKKSLNINTRDELSELSSSLNEMTFNLQKTYTKLNSLNKQLLGDIEFEKLQEKKKKQLIMTINHELKTPVSVIKGMVEGMIDDVGRYKNKKKYLKEVLSQLDKIDSMTKDLTYSLKLEDLAKVDDSTNLLILKDSLDSVKELAKQKRVKINMKIIDQEVQMNEELLTILTTNLLNNAVKYTEDSKVFMKTYTIDDVVYLEIRNSGIISKDDLEKIFEPYYRINIDTEGTGLGLFIVKQICEIYHAEYKVYNDNYQVVSKVGFKKV